MRARRRSIRNSVRTMKEAKRCRKGRKPERKTRAGGKEKVARKKEGLASILLLREVVDLHTHSPTMHMEKVYRTLARECVAGIPKREGSGWTEFQRWSARVFLGGNGPDDDDYEKANSPRSYCSEGPSHFWFND